MPNQQINCNVHACQYNDQSHACTLSDILVGNSAPSPHEQRDTECASFQASTAG